MANPYTVLLGHVARTDPADVLLYQASPQLRTIIRDILFNVNATSPQSFNLYYLSGGQQYWLTRVAVEDSKPFHLELRQVLPSDAELRINAAGLFWVCLVTGYELSVP